MPNRCLPLVDLIDNKKPWCYRVSGLNGRYVCPKSVDQVEVMLEGRRLAQQGWQALRRRLQPVCWVGRTGVVGA